MWLSRLVATFACVLLPAIGSTQGVKGRIEVVPNLPISFPAPNSGTAAKLEIRSVGTGAAKLEVVRITVPHNDVPFKCQVDGQPQSPSPECLLNPVTLQPGQKATVEVYCTATGMASFWDEALRIRWSDPNNNPSVLKRVNIALHCDEGSPKLVTEVSKQATGQPYEVDPGDPISLTTFKEGIGAGPARKIWFINRGAVPLVVDEVDLSQFQDGTKWRAAGVQCSAGTSLAMHDSCRVSYWCAPTATGTYSATGRFRSNDPAHPEVTFSFRCAY